MSQPLSTKASARMCCVSLFCAVMCFVAILPMPYGYYVFLRWAISLAALTSAIDLLRTGYWGVSLAATAMIILFNPIIQMTFARDTWKWLDAGAGTLWLYFCATFIIHFIRVSGPTPSPAAGTFADRLDQVADDAADRIRSRAAGRSREPELRPGVQDVLELLERQVHGFDSRALQLVTDRIRTAIATDPAGFAEAMRSGPPLEQWAWAAVANIAGDLVESGDYHVYRGILDPMGPGKDLVRIFDTATDELLRLGAVDADYAERQRTSLRNNIRDVG